MAINRPGSQTDEEATPEKTLVGDSRRQPSTTKTQEVTEPAATEEEALVESSEKNTQGQEKTQREQEQNQKKPKSAKKVRKGLWNTPQHPLKLKQKKEKSNEKKRSTTTPSGAQNDEGQNAKKKHRSK